MNVQELIAELEGYGEHMDVMVKDSNDKQVEIDSVGTAPIIIEDHEHEGMTAVQIYTIDN